MIPYPHIDSIYKKDERGRFLSEYSKPEFFYLADNIWIFTEKVDGTNIRVMWDCNQIKIGGKTDNAQIPAKLIESINSSSLLKNLLDNYPQTPMCLYCEGYGAGIQSGGKYSQNQTIVLFDIFIDKWWLKREDVEDISKHLQMDIVPIIGKDTIKQAEELTKQGFKSRWGDFIAEGIVLRPAVELFDRNNKRIITKVKHKDFKK